jgi:hypothetical protein
MSNPLNSPLSILRRFPYAHLVWLLALTSGFGSLISYQMRPGAAGAATGDWPRGLALNLDPSRLNLVVFAHPKCPCTNATLDELKLLLTQGRGRISSSICFFDPGEEATDWTHTRLIAAAREVPELNVLIDRNGILARKFGALTSGQVLVFDGTGHRVFAGGITGSRGHTGENRGRNLVLELARGETVDSAQTPVFGCALFDAETPGPRKL